MVLVDCSRLDLVSEMKVRIGEVARTRGLRFQIVESLLHSRQFQASKHSSQGGA